MKNTYNFIFWNNPYENLWYAISRDTQLEFFNGDREKSVYYKSKEISTLVEIVNKDITKIVFEECD